MVQFVETLWSGDSLQTAARFLLVGMLGTLIDFSIFAFLNLQLGMTALLANTLSYSAGIINNYAFHRRWTFVHRPQKAAGKQFLRFAVASLSALAVNNLIVLALALPLGALFGSSALGAVFAKICAIVVGLSWNFLANYLWTFRAEPNVSI